MTQPKMAAKQPIKVALEAGKKYFWCTCGESADQPYCDGKHKGSGFTPLAFVPEQESEAYLCQCKATDKGPYCDGKHKSL